MVEPLEHAEEFRVSESVALAQWHSVELSLQTLSYVPDNRLNQELKA
jgi:hypothetical protein